MSELPKWVWDLIADLLDQEDSHPKLLFRSGEDYKQWDWCPCIALDKVPDHVKATARIIAAYRRNEQ